MWLLFPRLDACMKEVRSNIKTHNSELTQSFFLFSDMYSAFYLKQSNTWLKDKPISRNGDGLIKYLLFKREKKAVIILYISLHYSPPECLCIWITNESWEESSSRFWLNGMLNKQFWDILMRSDKRLCWKEILKILLWGFYP